jgi:hypothetical protein
MLRYPQRALDDERKRRSGPDAWHPVHRHDVAVWELAIGGCSSTVAVATRQERQCQRGPRTAELDDVHASCRLEVRLLLSLAEASVIRPM